MRLLQKMYIVALLLYPAFAFLLFWRVTKASVHNWMFLGMALPHFCVWLALLSIPFALQVKRWNLKWLKWIDRNFGMFIVVGLVVLLGARYAFEALPSERIISEYISRGTFEKEPWKSRIVEDLDENGRHPHSNYRVYPIHNSMFSIAQGISFAVYYGDSREPVEELLAGTKSFSVIKKSSSGPRECTMYALPFGYYRYTPLIVVYYEEGHVCDISFPEWFLDIMT